ncbi:MAG: small subunit ribosomal protein S18 [Parcubacteria group bacterium Greene0714_36]|nr:MAG: small subunit ribosomal protein S18 [Parcubacteria group bacterium Greene0714_36]
MEKIIKKQCVFCTTNRDVIDYKNAEQLRQFMSVQGKIYARKKSGLCARHQRKLAVSVKCARYLALVPFTTR